MEPLIRDFQAVAPTIAVEYTEYVTTDLFSAAQAACDAGQLIADVVLSSSVDQLVKLVNDGCALKHRSPATAALPSWMQWRDEVFGFTFEPAVIVYNRELVPPEDVRRTHTELIELLRTKAEQYHGKVGSYDIAQSGIGYLFASFDARGTTTYGRLVEAFGRVGLVARCCTTDLLSELADGRLAIGYNLLGSYAVGAVRNGAPLRIVIPRDYVLVLSRAALVPVHARNPVLAFRFIDYLLSPRGQQKAREASFFFSLEGLSPDEVDGPLLLSSSGLLRPITIGPGLLAVQDRSKRERFLSEWHRSIRIPAAAP
ncbi:MAG TPA: ABC transporter substrate-binding protein [Microvirga sp.]|nr:ABC transporter substrate-binding protein [Microvirga sp.]